MKQKIVTGILRHMLTAVGGALVASGYMDDAQLQAAIGAIITLICIAWSVWSKYRAEHPALAG